MTATAHPPQAMIADYAAGRLSRGMTLAVAAHVSLCRACRDRAARLVTLCGTLFATCAEPVPPSQQCLAATLARLDKPSAPKFRGDLPAPLCGCLAASGALAWLPSGPGISRARLDGFPGEEVALVRAEAGARVPAHRHAGLEATLVLEGGMPRRRPDLLLRRHRLLRRDGRAQPRSRRRRPCLYLVVDAAA